MSYTAVQDPKERANEYMNALRFYMSELNARIVVVDNSGYQYDEVRSKYPNRLEVLSFDGNSYRKELGKGYGEGEIIRYAFANSRFIRESDCPVAKVTGRHIISNIRQIEKAFNFFRLFNSNFLFASIKEFHKWVVSDFFIAPQTFYSVLNPALSRVNDSEKYYFECCVYDVLQEMRQRKEVSFVHIPFPLKQVGKSGTTGMTIQPHGSSFKFLIKCILYCLSLDKLVRSYGSIFYK